MSSNEHIWNVLGEGVIEFTFNRLAYTRSVILAAEFSNTSSVPPPTPSLRCQCASSSEPTNGEHLL